MDIRAIREQTPCSSIYLDHTAASVPPLVVGEAIADYFREIQEWGSKWLRHLERHYEQLRQARADLGRLVNARFGEEEIALTGSGSESIGIIAQGLKWNEGDEVVLSRAEQIANVVPWLRLKDRFGIKVHFAEIVKPGVVSLDSLRDLIGPQTRLVSLTHAPNALGTIQPLAQVGKICRERGVLFAVDASVTAGVVPVDVQSMGCDFLAASGRKYLRGPAGTGFLYIRKERIEEVDPLIFSWKSGTWDHRTNEYRSLASIDRFVGGEPNFPGWIGLGRAVAYHLSIGDGEAVFSRVAELTRHTCDLLADIPAVRVIGAPPDQRNGIVNLVIEGRDPKILAMLLQARGVIVEGGDAYCPRPLQLYGADSALRFAVHYWNTLEDIDEAVRLLRKVIA